MHSNPGFITWDLTDQSQPLGNDSQNSLRPFAWRKSFIATCKFQRIDPLLRQQVVNSLKCVLSLMSWWALPSLEQFLDQWLREIYGATLTA